MVAPNYLFYISGGGWAPGRTGGWRRQEAGADMENAAFEKPNPAKFFVYHLMPTQKENFLFVFFITSKVIDATSWKLNKFVGLLQAVSVENFPATKVSQVKCRQTA